MDKRKKQQPTGSYSRACFMPRLWCRRGESNSHGRYAQRFLRPPRLPFRHFGISYESTEIKSFADPMACPHPDHRHEYATTGSTSLTSRIFQESKIWFGVDTNQMSKSKHSHRHGTKRPKARRHTETYWAGLIADSLRRHQVNYMETRNSRVLASKFVS